MDPVGGSGDITALPKAHLHLHFTGAMRHATMLELAERHGIRLPDALTADRPMRLAAADERGWFRFQRLYDTARSVLQQEDDVRRLLHEVAEDERAEGSGWLEIQVDPSGYANRFGGLTAFTELVIDALEDASRATGVGIGLIIGANRTRHPLDARTLARLAVQFADRGVIGFGLANDERRGRTEEFTGAFRIATAAGLLAVPHGGELLGADSVLSCLDALGADRVGHGIRSSEDPRVLERLAAAGTTCEVNPASNVALGVYREPADVPLRTLLDAGVPVALGADDPLLFGSRLVDQYTSARHVHGLGDGSLAELARMSVRASRAPSDLRDRLLAGIEAWSTPADRVRASSPPGPAPGGA